MMVAIKVGRKILSFSESSRISDIYRWKAIINDALRFTVGERDMSTKGCYMHILPRASDNYDMTLERKDVSMTVQQFIFSDEQRTKIKRHLLFWMIMLWLSFVQSIVEICHFLMVALMALFFSFLSAFWLLAPASYYQAHIEGVAHPLFIKMPIRCRYATAWVIKDVESCHQKYQTISFIN